MDRTFEETMRALPVEKLYWFLAAFCSVDLEPRGHDVRYSGPTENLVRLKPILIERKSQLLAYLNGYTIGHV